MQKSINTTTEAIKVEVNIVNLLANLGHAFSNPLTVISELLQNARRAGSPFVDLTYRKEDKVLTVYDEGCGISSYQNLLTIAESGWDQEIKNNECPYGMGFLSSLYACDRIVASSISGTVDFETSHALSFGEIPVATGKKTKRGSSISLCGFKSEINEAQIEKMVMGFPLPVFFNGKDLPRPYAQPAFGGVETDLGIVSVSGMHHGTQGFVSDSIKAFLLGFEVYSDNQYCGGGFNIIHLDPRKFQGRMPDRKHLADEAAAVKAMRSEIKQQWLKFLDEKFAELDTDAFLLHYGHAMLKHNNTILNKLSFLPPLVTEGALDHMLGQVDENRRYLGVNEVITKEQVLSGEVILCESFGNSITEDEILPALFAYKNGFRQVKSGKIPEDHWARPFIRNLELEAFTLVINGEKARSYFDGFYVQGKVVTCESYTVSVAEPSCLYGPTSITITDAPVCHINEDDYEIEAIIFPGTTADASVVEQGSTYTTDDVFDDSGYEDDKNELYRILKEMRGAAPHEIFSDLVSDIYWSKYDILKGQSFVVTFDDKGAPIIAPFVLGMGQVPCPESAEKPAPVEL